MPEYLVCSPTTSVSCGCGTWRVRGWLHVIRRVQFVLEACVNFRQSVTTFYTRGNQVEVCCLSGNAVILIRLEFGMDCHSALLSAVLCLFVWVTLIK